MESHKKDEDNDEDSNKTNWCIIFLLLRARGFSEEEILNLSYPKFKAYMNNINNPILYPVMIPYLGSGEEQQDNQKIDSKEELLTIVADMNKEFLQM